MEPKQLSIFHQTLVILIMNIAQVLRLRKAFASKSSANKKLSKNQLHKIGQ